MLRRLLETMRLCSAVSEKIIKILLTIAMTIVFVTVVFGVLSRNIQTPIVWLNELGTFACIWAVFLGMALAYRYRQFPNVDIWHSHISVRTRRYLEIFYDALALMFITAVLVSSRVFLGHLKSTGQISPELRLPMVYAYLGPVIGYIFTAIMCLTSLLERLSGNDTAAGAGDVQEGHV